MKTIKIEGYVRLEHRNAEGNLLFDTGFMKNGTPNVAFAVFSGLVGNTGSQTAFTFIAVGTSSTAFAAADTALGAEISDSGLSRAAATVSRVTTTQTNDTLQLAKTFTATGTKTVTEAGIFNAASGVIMGGRVVFTGIGVVNTDTLTITYKVKFA